MKASLVTYHADMGRDPNVVLSPPLPAPPQQQHQLQAQHEEHQGEEEQQTTPVSTHGKTSQFPWVDEAVNELATPGHIKQVLEKSNGTIIYLIEGSKFCRTVGRQHNHNNVYYYIDRNGENLYQTCYSPRCHGSKHLLKVIKRIEGGGGRGGGGEGGGEEEGETDGSAGGGQGSGGMGSGH